MTRVDLDELEQIARSEHASVVVDMIAELRAARPVVKACWQLVGCPPGEENWLPLVNALEAYDGVVGATHGIDPDGGDQS